MSLVLFSSLIFGLMKADELLDDTMNNASYDDVFDADAMDINETDLSYIDYPQDLDANTDGIDIYSVSGGVCISMLVSGHDRMYLVHDGNTASLDYTCSAVWYIDDIHPNDPLCDDGECKIIQTIPGTVPPALTLNDESDSQNNGHLHHTKGRGSWFKLLDRGLYKELFNVHLDSINKLALLCGADRGRGAELIWSQQKWQNRFCGWTIEPQRTRKPTKKPLTNSMDEFGEIETNKRRRPTRRPTPRPTPSRFGNKCIGQDIVRGFEFLTQSKSLVLERGIIQCRKWEIRRERGFNCGNFDCYSIKLIPDNLYLGKDIIDGVLSFNLRRSELWVIGAAGSIVDDLWALKHTQTNQFLCGRGDIGIGIEGQVFFSPNGDHSGCHWRLK